MWRSVCRPAGFRGSDRRWDFGPLLFPGLCTGRGVGPNRNRVLFVFCLVWPASTDSIRKYGILEYSTGYRPIPPRPQFQAFVRGHGFFLAPIRWFRACCWFPPLWGPCLVLVAKPKEGPAKQKKAKKKRKIGLGGRGWRSLRPPHLAISLICPH